MIIPVVILASTTAECPARADYARFKDLPAASRAAIPPMAERGASFQATDVIMGRPLPGRRFVSASQSGCRITLRFEYGGIARGTGTMILERRKGAWKLVSQSTKLGS